MRVESLDGARDSSTAEPAARDRVPLHVLANEEAEEAVLACFLNSSRAVADHAASLVPSDFYYPHTRAVFEAVKALTDAGKIVSRPGVLEELRSADAVSSLTHKGGDAYVLELEAGAVRMDGIAELVGLIKDKAKRRQLLAANREMLRAIVDGEDADGIAEVFASRLATLHDASPKGSDQLVDLGEALTPDLIALQQEPLSTGIAAIDAQLGGGYFPGELVVVQASTGVGKTSLSIFSQCTGIASDASRPGLYVSTEMQPHELQARRACQVLNAEGVRCTWRDVLRGVVPIERTKAATANTRVKVLAMRPSVSAVGMIRDAAMRLADAYGKPPFIVADYLQALSLGTGDDRRIAVGTTIYDLQALAAELRTHVVAISAISRAGNTKEKRDSDDPYDFLNVSKEAGEIELAAAVVAHLDVKAEQDEQGYRDARFILCKTRFGSLGIVGLKFHGASGIFEANAFASLTKLDRQVLDVVRTKAVSSANAVATHLKTNRPAVLASVKKLRGIGIITNDPTGGFSTKWSGE